MLRRTSVVAVCLVACLPVTCLGLHSLTPVSYLQLPTSITAKGQLRYEGLNRQAALGGAFDVNNNILYAIGSRLLHLIDIADPAHPTLLFTHQIPAGEGNLKAVTLCGDEVAVAMDAKVTVELGKVVFYRTHTIGDNITELTESWNATVGASPTSLQYTADCHRLLVANAGDAGKDAQGVYLDPQGTVTILDTSHGAGGAAQVEVNFKEYDYGQPHYNPAVRVPSMHIPYTTLQPRTLLSQDVEPSHVTLSPDGTTAWVSLPDNNAIARFDVGTGRVTSLTPLPLKDWTNSPIDTSDEDGGVHRRLYKDLFSLRQPTVIKTLVADGKTCLITADTGAVKTYSRAKHGFDWTDATLAQTLVIDSSHTELKSDTANFERLGRLHVSRLDGKNFFNEEFTYLAMYGGRGFSVWNADGVTMTSQPVYDSAGTLEESMEAAYRPVFNCDYSAKMETYDSPENLRDTVSDDLGAKVTALDVQEDGSTTFLVLGSSSTGTLYLYTVDTSGATPQPRFQHIYRAGQTDVPWRDMYLNATAGDLYITNIGIIPSVSSPTHKPLVYVISRGSGSLSLYEIQ